MSGRLVSHLGFLAPPFQVQFVQLFRPLCGLFIGLRHQAVNADRHVVQPPGSVDARGYAEGDVGGGDALV